MKLKVNLPDGQTIEINAGNDWTVMEAMRDAGVPIIAQCGGGCSCATCHVQVAPEWREELPSVEDNERELLELADSYEPTASRLSCQLICSAELDGLEVTLRPDSWEG